MNDEFMTPLHYACMEENQEIVEFLFAKGANVKAVNYEGETVLDIAKEKII